MLLPLLVLIISVGAANSQSTVKHLILTVIARPVTPMNTAVSYQQCFRNH